MATARPRPQVMRLTEAAADRIKAVMAKADKPVAGLLTDLKQRGLIDRTLVLWGGEFGRTPFAQGSDGRDHNPFGFTVWLAGGGTKPGVAYGATDEYSYHAVEIKVQVHDLQAALVRCGEWVRGRAEGG